MMGTWIWYMVTGRWLQHLLPGRDMVPQGVSSVILPCGRVNDAVHFRPYAMQWAAVEVAWPKGTVPRVLEEVVASLNLDHHRLYGRPESRV